MSSEFSQRARTNRITDASSLPGVSHGSFPDDYSTPSLTKACQLPQRAFTGLFLPKKLFQKQNPHSSSSICLGRGQGITLAFISTPYKLAREPPTHTQKEAEPHPVSVTTDSEVAECHFQHLLRASHSFPRKRERLGACRDTHSSPTCYLSNQAQGLLHARQNPTGPDLPTCPHTHSQPLLFRGSHVFFFFCPSPPSFFATGYC